MNQKFDYLIPKLSTDLSNEFFKMMLNHSEFNNDVDTSPLLNMCVATFISALINSLKVIKNNTIGEIELIDNIDLMINTLLKSIEDLPFVKGIEFV